MDTGGYIKLHRQILTSDAWRTGEPFTLRCAWLDLLLHAAWEPRRIMRRGRVVELQPGQQVTSVRELAERWSTGRTRTHTLLKTLKTRTHIETQQLWAGTLITVSKWLEFQTDADTERTHTPETVPHNANHTSFLSKEKKEIHARESSLRWMVERALGPLDNDAEGTQ